ncbi:MAG: hypothetical protein BCS36_04195 [Desulfovibrio sp. MES5]|nr:MAG: hypothetical protein BCS36_04195 [Desulfovibrio sp. MES5]
MAQSPQFDVLQHKSTQHSFNVDLHVHSRHSTNPSQWALQKIGCSESYTLPSKIYDIAKSRGMDYVTITDHDTIAGALEIAHLPQVFISEEVSAYFPDDRCEIHVLAWNITEKQHEDIQRLRSNIYDLVPYLIQQDIPHACAHPLCPANDKLTIQHVEKLILLFSVFELNGARNDVQNETLRSIVAALTPEMTSRFEEEYNFASLLAQPWNKHFMAGSDDHSSCNIARSFTRITPVGGTDEGNTLPAPAHLLQAVMQGNTSVNTVPATPLCFAHNLYAIGYQFYKNSTDLAQDMHYSSALRFAENMLTGAPELKPLSVKTRMLTLAGVLLRFGRGKRTVEKSMQANLLEAAEQVIAQFPQLQFAASETNTIQALKDLPQREEMLTHFISEVTEKVQHVCVDAVLEDILKGNFFNVFKLIGSIGSLYALLAPYGIGYSLFSKDRKFAESCLQHYGIQNCMRPQMAEETAIAYFTDTYCEVNGVAKSLQITLSLAAAHNKKLDMLTCMPQGSNAFLNDPKLAPINFPPTGSFSMPEYPELSLHHPPALKIIQHCFTRGYTLLHSVTPGPMGLIALLAAKMLNLPIHATYHTSFPQYVYRLTDDSSLEETAWRYIFWYYNQMDAVFAPSEATRQDLIARGLQPQKIHVYPRGIDASVFTPSWQRGDLSKEQQIKFLYVGRLSKEKSLHLLMEAFRRVYPQVPNAVLTLVGDGPQFGELQKMAKDLPVKFTGYLEGESLIRAYEKADIFVFPSATDTYSRVVLEAQAAGLATIVSGVGGPKENIIPGKSGLVVEQENAEAYAAAMLSLACHPERMQAMKRAARSWAESRPLRSAFMAQWQLFEKLKAQSQAA